MKHASSPMPPPPHPDPTTSLPCTSGSIMSNHRDVDSISEHKQPQKGSLHSGYPAGVPGADANPSKYFLLRLARLAHHVTAFSRKPLCV